MMVKYALKIVTFAMCIIVCFAGDVLCGNEQPPFDEHQIMRILFTNLHVELPSGQRCGPSGAVTVGKFLQTTLAYFAQEKTRGGLSQVDSVCIKLDDEITEDLLAYYSESAGFPASVRKALAKKKKGSVLYQYTTWWKYAEKENTWSRGIQFLIESDGSPVEGSFRCLSMP